MVIYGEQLDELIDYLGRCKNVEAAAREDVKDCRHHLRKPSKARPRPNPMSKLKVAMERQKDCQARTKAAWEAIIARVEAQTDSPIGREDER